MPSPHYCATATPTHFPVLVHNTLVSYLQVHQPHLFLLKEILYFLEADVTLFRNLSSPVYVWICSFSSQKLLLQLKETLNRFLFLIWSFGRSDTGCKRKSSKKKDFSYTYHSYGFPLILSAAIVLFFHYCITWAAISCQSWVRFSCEQFGTLVLK